MSWGRRAENTLAERAQTLSKPQHNFERQYNREVQPKSAEPLKRKFSGTEQICDRTPNLYQNRPQIGQQRTDQETIPISSGTPSSCSPPHGSQRHTFFFHTPANLSNFSIRCIGASEKLQYFCRSPIKLCKARIYRSYPQKDIESSIEYSPPFHMIHA